MGIKVGNRDASVTIADDLENMVRRVVDKSAPTLIPRLEEVVTELRADAEADWPIGRERSGIEAGRTHSKELFESGIRLNGDGTIISGFVSNPRSYVWMVKPKAGEHAGKNIFSEVVRKPARKVGKALVQELASDLGKLARGES